MHNRDIIWTTDIGEKFKIHEIKTAHLENIVKLLKQKNANSETIKDFNQELRYRKLNNIENNPDYKDIF